MAQLLTSSNSTHPMGRFGAICLFGGWWNFVVYGPASVVKYSQLLAKAICSDTDLDIREASSYGIAQLAHHAPQIYVESLVQHLRSIATKGTIAKAKEHLEHIRLVENLVSALANMILFKSANSPHIAVSKADVIKIFLAILPLQEDCDEVQFNHKGFCDFVKSGKISTHEKL
jgi:hypothetical protein